MKLRQLFDYRFLSKNPPYVALLASFFVFLGLMAAYLFFSSAMSLVMVAFSSLLILPYIVMILKTERMPGGGKLSGILKRHDRLIKFYIYLFFGMAITYMLLYIALAPGICDIAFNSQTNLITPGPIGFYFNSGFFTQIIANNLTLVFVCVFLSLFYGTGAVFILNYNASVVGVMYGSPVRPLIWGAYGAPVLFQNMLVYVPHTLLEVLAYLLAAISGGILSNALVTRAGKGNSLNRILLKDSLFFLAIAVVLILAGGFVETVLPPLFSLA